MRCYVRLLCERLEDRCVPSLAAALDAPFVLDATNLFEDDVFSSHAAAALSRYRATSDGLDSHNTAGAAIPIVGELIGPVEGSQGPITPPSQGRTTAPSTSSMAVAPAAPADPVAPPTWRELGPARLSWSCRICLGV
jgi:hypothetical protein